MAMIQEQDIVINSLKSYLKLCVKSNSRAMVLKDTTFLQTVSIYINTDNATIMTYIIKILLILTERKEDAIQLAAIPELERSVGNAAERAFAPAIIRNLLIVSSRIHGAKNAVFKPTDGPVLDECSTIRRNKKFMMGKSKQMVFEFDEDIAELKGEIEAKLLKKKGVVSVYFTRENKRIVIRTITSIEANEIADIIFDCGCEMISQIITIDGEEEHFPMYASERQTKEDVALPDYLDDVVDASDPNSCMVTNDYAQSQPGWFSGVSSLVKGLLW